MEDAVHALIMAFSVLIFIIALSIVIYMFGQATSTAENLLYYADETNYYDNIELQEGQVSRIVDIDTVILTLYRYYKENFCVKIYDAPQGGNPAQLLQVFDVDLEGKVRKAAMISDTAYLTPEQIAYRTIYNDNEDTSSYKQLYMFEAPWIGSTDEDMKTRVDFYINGNSGYINNTHVNYIGNKFYKLREYNKDETITDAEKVYFREEFIRYTYSGDTFVTEEGEILVEGAKPEDKIVIIYTATDYKNI